MTDITERFPLQIGFGSTGGPRYRTTIVSAYSGREERNSDWSYPLHVYNVATGIKSSDDMAQFLRFLHAAAGTAYTFPFRDRNDWKSCAVNATPDSADQIIATATAGQTQFQLIKTYTATGRSQTRAISHPVSGTLLVEVDGTPMIETTHYTVSYTTGVITFLTPMSGGEVVKAGYEFDVPCRFAEDAIEFSLENSNGDGVFYGSGSASVVEVRV